MKNYKRISHHFFDLIDTEWAPKLNRKSTLKKLIAVILFFASLQTLAADGGPSVSAHVSLSPLGSFNATSTKVYGSGIKTGESFSAKEIKVPTNSLKTDNSLRDNHLHKTLEQPKFKFIVISDIQAAKGKGTAKLTIRNITRDVAFKFTVINAKSAEARFKINLKDFQITGINYQGVGVEDTVEITATLPYETK